jgi:hypothetical protein
VQLGVQPQTPATPAPPHVCPVPVQLGHGTEWPQLLIMGTHLPPAHVVAIGSSVHALHLPVLVLHPNWHAVSAPH